MQTVVMIAMRFLIRQCRQAVRQLFHPGGIGKNNAIMIRIFTECAIWWKMPFFTLSAGGV